MRVASARWVLRLWLASAWLGPAAAAATRVYGLEHQVEGPYERILVFADGPLTPRYEEHAKDSADLVLEGATLDRSAPRRLVVPPDGNFLEASAREQGGETPRVVLQIRHAPGVTPRLVQRGSQLALELPRREPASAGGIDLAGRDVPLQQIVERISRHTGRPVMFDDSLQGSMTIWAQKPFSSGEALLLLDTLLLMKGFAAMPTPGGVRKIVQIEGAPWPFVADVARASGDEAVTTLLTPQAIRADTLLLALQPMLGRYAIGFVHMPSNALILGGSAALITRIVDVVHALDATGAERLFLRPLRYADAETTAAQLQEAFGDDGLIAVWPDERTNTLGVRARQESVGAVRDFLAKLDRPAPARGELHVIPVEHSDAEQLAEILRALQSGDAGRISAARGGGAATFDPVSGAGALTGRSFSVVVDPPTHSLVVQADPDTARALFDVVAELDRIPRQVDVEVTVMEISASHGVDLSFDYFLPLTDADAPDDPIAFVAGVPSGSPSALFDGTPVEQTLSPLIGLPPVDKALHARFTREPVLVPLVIGGQVVPVAIPRDSAAITAEDRDIYTRLVLRPRLTVISGEEHEIFIGDNVPILTEQAQSTDPLQVSQNVERQDVGVDLRVKPTLGEAGGIVLDLTVEVSALAPSDAGVSERVGPTIRERTLTTRVRLEHDRVAVIGWQAGPGRAFLETGTPFLKDLPILGWLFRATEAVDMQNNLLIAVAARREDPEVRVLAEMLARALGRETPEIAAPSEPSPAPQP